MELPIIELSGAPQQMGEDFGACCREEIHQLYACRLQRLLKRSAEKGKPITEEQALGVARDCLEQTRRFDPIGWEEFSGIARGAGITAAQCFLMQGLTDVQDLLALGSVADGAGCSSAIIGADRSACGNILLAQTWDLQTDNLPYVRLVHRRPHNAPETWSLTLAGCLTLIGINAAGIAVGTTNIVTTDVRIGVQYLSVLHRALRSDSFSEAVDSICRAPRSGAHYYYVGGPEGQAVGLECSARQVVPHELHQGVFVHCNHPLKPEIAALQAEPPSTSSLHRQKRLAALLTVPEQPATIGAIKQMLSDHDGGPDRCICRHDVDNINTNAVVIMCPATREIHACRAQAHVGRWVVRTAGADPAGRISR